MGSKSTRNIAHDKLNGAVGNLENAGEKLLWFMEVYTEQHPELTEPILVILEALDTAIDVIKQTKDKV